MDECRFLLLEIAANDRQVLSDRSVREELPNQSVAITCGLGKEKDAGGEAIDAMNDIGPLPSRFEFRREQRQRGRGLSAFHGNSEHSSRFIDGHNGVVFVQDDESLGTPSFPHATQFQSVPHYSQCHRRRVLL